MRCAVHPLGSEKSQKRVQDTPGFKFPPVLAQIQPFLSRSVEKRGDQSQFKSLGLYTNVGRNTYVIIEPFRELFELIELRLQISHAFGARFLQKPHLFLYVCPEPVLVNRSFLVAIKRLRKGVSRTSSSSMSSSPILASSSRTAL